MIFPSLSTFTRTFLDRIKLSTDKVGQTLSFELHGQLFSQPRLLPKKGASAENKAGLLSWLALMDGVPVKIYECHDESQALFIREISTNSPLKQYFPKCFKVIDKYLVVEWVLGKQVTWKWASKDERLLSKIAQMQVLMHTFAIEKPQISRCYYADFLRQRLAKFKGVFPIDEAIEEIYATLDEGTIPIEHRISHPDVTAANLILENGTGKLKIIDNEFMTQNGYYLFDLFNTLNFGKLRNQLVKEYLSHYVQNGGKLTSLVEHERFFEAMWQLRLVGTALQIGDLQSAFELTNRLTGGIGETHPLIKLVKENFV